ncbi:MAG: hypothetical protein JHC93_08790 [Parachlamydiales bacterium]|nr:hypothetical protein [Parachlamydiales bacterium]
MSQKHFLFSPGIWLGQGAIVFSTTPEELKFYMRWTIRSTDEGKIIGLQEIELSGVSEKMVNEYHFMPNNSDKFGVRLENDILGKIRGQGFSDDRIVAWEFRQSPAEFEGVEVYEKQEDGNYVTRAEYITSDQYRTTIRGKLWKTETPEPFKEEG